MSLNINGNKISVSILIDSIDYYLFLNQYNTFG